MSPRAPCPLSAAVPWTFARLCAAALGVAPADEAPVGFLRSSLSPRAFWRNFHVRWVEGCAAVGCGVPRLAQGQQRVAKAQRLAAVAGERLARTASNSDCLLSPPRSWYRWICRYVYVSLGGTAPALVAAMAVSTALHGFHRRGAGINCCCGAATGICCFMALLPNRMPLHHFCSSPSLLVLLPRLQGLAGVGRHPVRRAAGGARGARPPPAAGPGPVAPPPARRAGAVRHPDHAAGAGGLEGQG